LAGDRGDQCFVVATGQVAATDRASEKGVPGEQNCGVRKIVADSAGGMSGCVNGREFETRKRVRDIADWREVFCLGQPGVKCVIRAGVERSVRRVDPNGDVKSTGDRTNPADMVDMGVGQEDADGLKFQSLDFFDDFVGIVAGIKDQASSSSWIPGKIAVDFERADDDGLRVQGQSWISPQSIFSCVSTVYLAVGMASRRANGIS
jgi:hypothetical protein